jgi:hypothetical protein
MQIASPAAIQSHFIMVGTVTIRAWEGHRLSVIMPLQQLGAPGNTPPPPA